MVKEYILIIQNEHLLQAEMQNLHTRHSVSIDVYDKLNERGVPVQWLEHDNSTEYIQTPNAIFQI